MSTKNLLLFNALFERFVLIFFATIDIPFEFLHKVLRPQSFYVILRLLIKRSLVTRLTSDFYRLMAQYHLHIVINTNVYRPLKYSIYLPAFVFKLHTRVKEVLLIRYDGYHYSSTQICSSVRTVFMSYSLIHCNFYYRFVSLPFYFCVPLSRSHVIQIKFVNTEFL